MPNPIVHFEIMAAPGGKQALQDFYRTAFDWNIEPQDMGGGDSYGLIRPEEGGIGGAVDEAQDGGASVVVYIGVDDPQAFLDKAKENGAQEVMGVTTVPGMVTFAQFRDPAGNVVGIVANEPPPAP